MIGVLLAQATASGVELFFVLSAIVLVRPYASGDRAVNTASYFRRRAQRLYPPFWGAWLLSGFAIFLASRFPTWWTRGASLPEFSWWGWLSQFGLIYWGHTAFNFAWWSLTVEVCFYLLVPLLIPVLVRTRFKAISRAVLFVVSVMIASVGPVLMKQFFVSHADALPLLRLMQYASCFCAGLLLAQQRLPDQLASAAVAVGACWIAVSLRHPEINHHVGWGLAYFGCASLAMNRQSALARVLSSDLMIWLGERSYSLFLSHYAVFGLVSHFVSFRSDSKDLGYFIASRALSLPMSLLVAMLLFHFVERKFARNLMTAERFWPPMSGSTVVHAR